MIRKTILLIMLVTSIMTIAQLNMYVYEKDGTRTAFLATNVDSITFSNADDVQSETTTVAHEWVDLGLSVKWATTNVGANTPEEAGFFLAWGETEPKEEYSWKTYKWCKGTVDTQTKYCLVPSEGTVDDKSVLELADDAAHVLWGSPWRMPTMNELDELMDKCTWTWTTKNGVNGYIVTGPNGNSIFLPAVGYYDGTELCAEGARSDYWGSNVYGCSSQKVIRLYFRSNYKGMMWHDRCQGRLIRPVQK